MNIGTIVTPNTKGQVVIPKEIRDTMGINEKVPLNVVVRGSGIYMYPVEEVLTKEESNLSYLEILKITQGAWAGDDWPKTEKRRRKIELEASRKRKNTW